MSLGERKGRAPGGAGVTPSRPFRLDKGDVDVDDRPIERLVANRTPYDPGLLAGEQLFDELTNRRPPALRGQGRC